MGGGRKKVKASESAWKAQKAVPMFPSTIQASLGAQIRSAVISLEEKNDLSPFRSWNRILSRK